MASDLDVLETLCHRYAFGDVRALLPMVGLSEGELRRMRRLCLFGQRLLDLDAEDFDMTEHGADPDASPTYTALVDRARDCRMPQEPREPRRGALRSLRPAYALLLEVAGARHVRNEMANLVAVVHIMEEYLPLLIWESVWGHAGDPLSIGVDVRGDDSRFGSADRECAHNRADAAACARMLRVDQAPGEGWRAYLDRQHSNVSHALGVCAAECRDKCGVVNQLPTSVQESLAERCAVALAFGDSTMIKLRHAAPVGHGFGVPSAAEAAETWEHTRQVLGKRGGVAEAALAEDGYPLPGLPSLISALADAEIVPSTLLRDTAALAAAKLEAAAATLADAR
ncbi:MAG: hypothetical protein ACRDXX_09645 [Stackebrandtia sp.]